MKSKINRNWHQNSIEFCLQKSIELWSKSKENLTLLKHDSIDFSLENQKSIGDWFSSKINRSIDFFQSWSLWAPQPPELAIWRSGPGTVHIHRSLRSAVRVQAWQHPELAEMTQGGRQAGEGEEGEGPAPLLKSRDPLLAGGEKNLQSPAHKTAARTHTKSNYITYMIFSHIHSRWLHQSQTNRRAIAMQRFTIADVKIYIPIHNS